MPNKKKRIFTRDNSVKFRYLHGNSQATNADGETLQNVFVPVSKNYQPGSSSSLLMANIAALCNSELVEDPNEEPDLEKIIEQFDDVDSEDEEILNLPSQMKELTFSPKKRSKVLYEEVCEENVDKFSDDNDGSIYDDVDSQFSDCTDDSQEVYHKKAEPVDYSNCPENLKILNARFEKVYEEYDEDQIGPLDDEDICGYLSTDCDRVKNLLDSEFSKKEVEIELGCYDENIKEKILQYAEDSGEENMVEIVTEKPLEFDCESILSTYSNKYNHPAVIKEEKVKKIKIPNNPLKKNLTKSQLKKLDTEKDSEGDSSDDDVSYTIATSVVSTVRVKGETPEQRRERKREFKEAKRESRMLKKENKLAFKREKKIQTAQNLNIQRNAGMKLL